VRENVNSVKAKSFKAFLQNKLRINVDYVGKTVNSMLTDVKAYINSTEEASDNEIFEHFLNAIAEKNPDITLVLEDTKEGGRFFRFFACFPGASKLFGNGTLKIMSIDGAHSKNPNFQGIYVFIVTKTGDGHILPQAMAAIPSQNGRDLGWVIKMLKCSGFDLNDIPIFTDRGKLLFALSLLEQFDIFINWKFCGEHIIRNVITKFKLKEDGHPTARHAVNKLQASSSLETYFNCLRHVVTDLSPEI